MPKLLENQTDDKAIKILKEYEQQDLATPIGKADTDPNKTQKLKTRDPDTGARTPGKDPEAAKMESKSYDIDFSKWKPMIKNSY